MWWRLCFFHIDIYIYTLLCIWHRHICMRHYVIVVWRSMFALKWAPDLSIFIHLISLCAALHFQWHCSVKVYSISNNILAHNILLTIKVIKYVECYKSGVQNVFIQHKFWSVVHFKRRFRRFCQLHNIDENHNDIPIQKHTFILSSRWIKSNTTKIQARNSKLYFHNSKWVESLKSRASELV